MFEHLDTLLVDHQTGMTDWQDDFLVTRRAGGPTAYGQYKQALRELYRRMRGLRELVCDREKEIIEIERLSVQMQTEADGYEQRLQRVELTRKRARLEEADRACQDCARELSRFYAQAVGLKDIIGALTPERRRELEHEMWMVQAKEMIACDFLSGGRLSARTIERINVLPEGPRKELNTLLENTEHHEQLIEWYQTRHADDGAPLNYEALPLPHVEQVIGELRKQLLGDSEV